MFDEGFEIGLVTYAFDRYPDEIKIIENTDIWVSIEVTESENLSEDGTCNPDISTEDSLKCFKQFFLDQLRNQTHGEVKCHGNFGNCSIPQVPILTFNTFSECQPFLSVKLWESD